MAGGHGVLPETEKGGRKQAGDALCPYTKLLGLHTKNYPCSGGSCMEDQAVLQEQLQQLLSWRRKKKKKALEKHWKQLQLPFCTPEQEEARGSQQWAPTEPFHSTPSLRVLSPVAAFPCPLSGGIRSPCIPHSYGPLSLGPRMPSPSRLEDGLLPQHSRRKSDVNPQMKKAEQVGLCWFKAVLVAFLKLLRLFCNPSELQLAAFWANLPLRFT